MRRAALAGVFTFGVLAHKQPVDVLGAGAGEGRFGAGNGADRADVGVELEGRAGGEEEAPERDVVGNIWGG